MKKNTIAFIFLLFAFCNLQAIEIKGRIVNSDSKQQIGFATVSLLKSDSSYVSGVAANDKGTFSLSGTFDKSDHILTAAYLGYKTSYIKISNLSSNIDLGDIDIREESKLLKEVTVTTERIQNKVDRQIILPDAMQIKSSSNAYDLLNNLSLARLLVNTVERTVSIGQEGVQLRINGMKSTANDVLAILPKNIKRVEYYDNPGVRFGSEGVGAVVDFIVVRDNNYGGYLSMDLQNAPFVEFGNDYGVIKLNHKASEFGFSYYASYRGYSDRWSEGSETFNFPDNPIKRTIIGDKSPMFYVDHGLNLSYNLTQVDKYMLNISFRDNFFNGDYVSASKTIYSGTNKKTFQQSDNEQYSNTPVLDVFYKRNLKGKQTLAFNIVGTHIHSEENRQFVEIDQDGETLTKFKNDVEGNKYSLIAEMAYDKEFDKIIFSAGIKHTQGYANNEYKGNNSFKSDMRNADSYAYSQINGKLGAKFSYSLGVGVSRLWFQQEKEDVTYYLFRPSVNMSYPLSKTLNISYNFTVDSRTPSLASLSNVEQQSNTYVINRGNPNLKPYKVYRNRLTLNYNKGIINSSFGASYGYYRKLFVSTYSIEGDKIISFSANHKAHHGFSVYGNVTIKLIKDILTFSGWIEGDRSIFYGNNNITHTYSSMYGGIRSNAAYNNFNLSINVNTRARSLWGEDINYAEYWQSIEASYKHKEAKFTIGMLYPFEKAWSRGGRNISKIAPSSTMTYIKENGQMLYARFSWNISFGRKYKAGQKSMDNTDNDKGIL